VKIEAEIDSKKVDKLFRDFGRQLKVDARKALQKTALYGITVILDRTAKGVGYEGPFKRYDPQYAQRKATGWSTGKVTRAFGGDSSGIVNLQVRGEMLSSMKTKVQGLEAEIKFGRKREANKAFWNNRTRPFFGFNRSEKMTLRKFFYKALTK
jgi:hypothetical protein